MLKRAVPLLDSLESLLSRRHPERGDLETLQTCVELLPRLDEALEGTKTSQEAAAVGVRQLRAHLAANHRLVTLGHEEQASLRGAVSVLLELARGTTPRPGELRLMTSPGRPWGFALLFVFLYAVPIAVLTEGTGQVPWEVALIGTLAIMGILFVRPAQWVLLPDRLFIAPRWWGIPRRIDLGDILRVRPATGRGSPWLATIILPDQTLNLFVEPRDRLVSLLRLLGSKWLRGLCSPSTFVVTEAVDESKDQAGSAVISPAGVLFVPRHRRERLLTALTREQLLTELPLDEVLSIIGHLPARGWAALGEHLESAAEAKWFPAATLERRGNVVGAADRRVRLTVSTRAEELGPRSCWRGSRRELLLPST